MHSGQASSAVTFTKKEEAHREDCDFVFENEKGPDFVSGVSGSLDVELSPTGDDGEVEVEAYDEDLEVLLEDFSCDNEALPARDEADVELDAYGAAKLRDAGDSGHDHDDPENDSCIVQAFL